MDNFCIAIIRNIAISVDPSIVRIEITRVKKKIRFILLIPIGNVQTHPISVFLPLRSHNCWQQKYRSSATSGPPNAANTSNFTPNSPRLDSVSIVCSRITKQLLLALVRSTNKEAAFSPTSLTIRNLFPIGGQAKITGERFLLKCQTVSTFFRSRKQKDVG